MEGYKTFKFTIRQGCLPDDTGCWTEEDWQKWKEYVEDLKERGELFKPKEFTINYKPLPAHDPIDFTPLESYRMLFIDTSNYDT